MPVASTWFTTLAAIREAQPDWAEIACYREPIARFLGKAYPKLSGDLRDDVVQEVLCAMHGSAVARFRPERGRFRHYLRGVIRNHVRKVLREHRAIPPSLDDEPDVADEIIDAESVEVIDLQACLVRAVRDFHDEVLRGDADQRQVLYCLSGRLIDQLSYAEIATKEGISRDAVKRRLQLARRGILRALVKGALEDHGQAEALEAKDLSRLAERVGEALASRRPAEEVLLEQGDSPALAGSQAAALELVTRFRAGVRWFPGLDSPDGQAFASALSGILETRGP